MPEQTFKERRSAIIDFNSKITLKIVIEIVVVAVMLTVGFMTMSHEISIVSDRLMLIEKRMELREDRRWTPLRDYLYMDEFSKENDLRMPRHPGLDN